jgi:hypothetical protein
MSRLAPAAHISIVAILLACAFSPSLGKNGGTNGQRQGEVVLTKLAAPVYPQIARTAHIAGDLVLTVEVKQDGTVESAVLVSGPPLLARVAIQSAERSQFECRNCGAEPTQIELTYTFRLVDGGCCVSPEGTSKSESPSSPSEVIPSVSQSQNHITVIDYTGCTCDMAPVWKVRSWKCLYLWRCVYR